MRKIDLVLLTAAVGSLAVAVMLRHVARDQPQPAAPPRQAPAVAATVAAASVYRGTPEILKMADWKGGRPDDDEIIRRSTDPGVMRPAEDDPLDYGISYQASERALRAAGRMPRVEDGPPSTEDRRRAGTMFYMDGGLPARRLPLTLTATRSSFTTYDPYVHVKTIAVPVPVVEFMPDWYLLAQHDPGVSPRGESVPAPKKRCPKCPNFPSEATIDGHPIDLPEFVFPTKPSRVTYPTDKGPRPAPPRGPAKPD